MQLYEEGITHLLYKKVKIRNIFYNCLLATGCTICSYIIYWMYNSARLLNCLRFISFISCKMFFCIKVRHLFRVIPTDMRQSRTARSEGVSTGNPEKPRPKNILFSTYVLRQHLFWAKRHNRNPSMSTNCVHTGMCVHIYMWGERNHLTNDFERQDLEI